MSELQVFENSNFGKVRVVLKDDNPWFVAKDVSLCLGYRDASNMIRMLDGDEKDTHTVSTRGGVQQLLIISESGFYKLVLKSRKPEAKQFKQWLDQEVLPVLHPVKVAATLPEPVKSDVQLFENRNFGKIRIIMRDGNPWFVAKDVCECLQHSNTSKAIRDYCKYAELIKPNESLGLESTPRGLNIIPESDLYRLIMHCHLPRAEKFQDWVVEDVLPSIRKTGSYSVNNNSQFNELTCLMKNVLEQNNNLSNQISRLAIENNEIKQMNQEIQKELQVMKPKVQFYNLYVENDSTGVDCKTAAKIIGKMGRNKLFAFLRRKNLIMYDNMPYQRYVNLGLFGIKYSKTGFPVLMITKKGIEKIGQLLTQNNLGD